VKAAVSVAGRWLAAHAHPLSWNGGAFAFLVAGLRELALKPEPRIDVATLLLGVGALCALVANSHRIELIEFLGLKAKTWRVLHEAEDVVASLRTLAANFGAVMVQANAASGRFGGESTYAERDAERAAIMRGVAAVGVSGEQLRAVEQADRQFVLSDYALGVERAFRRASVQSRAMHSIRSRWNRSGIPPTAAELREAFAGLSSLPTTAEELLRDMEHYETHVSHRRPDIWASRYSWIHDTGVALPKGDATTAL
jgi:hypothetical protein